MPSAPAGLEPSASPQGRGGSARAARAPGRGPGRGLGRPGSGGRSAASAGDPAAPAPRSRRGPGLSSGRSLPARAKPGSSVLGTLRDSQEPPRQRMLLTEGSWPQEWRHPQGTLRGKPKFEAVAPLRFPFCALHRLLLFAAPVRPKFVAPEGIWHLNR